MSSGRAVYLDHASSAPVLPAVADLLAELYRRGLGNSSSIHRAGVTAATELERARLRIATVLGAGPEEIFFTSGATESNNLVVAGALRAGVAAGRNELVVSRIEHSSVLEAARAAEATGAVLRYLDVDGRGHVSLDQLERLLGPRTALVSVMHANNEIGTIQDLRAIGARCRRSNVPFHSDGAQAFCKVPVDVREVPVDMYTFSGHKVHGPKGVGGLYLRSGVPLAPLFYGGGQEGALRPGTVAVELVVAMSRATMAFTSETRERLAALGQQLRSSLRESFPDIRFHGDELRCLPNILNFALPGASAKELLVKLDARGIRGSAGSACYSGKKTASHVLLALGLDEARAFEGIRVSWGVDTTDGEIDELTRALRELRGE
jgi:cysteine desulfurase